MHHYHTPVCHPAMHRSSSHPPMEDRSRDGLHSTSPSPPPECGHWSARTLAALSEEGGGMREEGGREEGGGKRDEGGGMREGGGRREEGGRNREEGERRERLQAQYTRMRFMFVHQYVSM